MEDNLKKRGCDEAKQKELQPSSSRWECPICGARIWSTNKQRHLRTKKHRDAKYVLMDKFEVS